MTVDSFATRDALLALAEESASDGVSTEDFARATVAQWRQPFPELVVEHRDVSPAWGQILAADRFDCDPCSGIEFQTVVVNGTDGWSAGGVILRFPGEPPDSFVAVDLPRSARPCTGREVATTFFQRDMPDR